MRAYIHGFHGRPWNYDCSVASYGFNKLGVETVLFSTNAEFDTRNLEDVVVAGTIIMWHAFSQRGIKYSHYDYPDELIEYLGRRIKRIRLKDLQKEMLPVFVKPVEEKTALGLVVNTWSDLSEYEYLEKETEMYCSEVVRFVSEWRCFLLYGKIIDTCFYFGNPDVGCDMSIIESAVRSYPNMPAGCALDFGVTNEGQTLLIEMNDGYSLGTYGLEASLYARLLTARWAELNGTEDIFKDIPI